MTSFRTKAIVPALVAIALLLAACGGGSSSPNAVPADEYATSVCGAMKDWLTTMQSEAEKMPTSFADTDEAKTAVTDFFSAIVASTDTMATAIKDAGVPDVDGGEEAAAALNETFTNVKTLFTDAQTKIEGMSTDDQAAFGAALTEVGTSMSDASSQATSGLSSITNADLNEAFSTNETCTSLSDTTTTP